MTTSISAFGGHAGWPILFTILLFAFPAGAAGPGPEPDIWTARQAVRFGLANSPDSRIAAQRIAAARAAQAQAAAARQPTLDLSAAYGQSDNPLVSFGNILNQGTFGNDIDFNDPGRTDALNLKAEMRYRFYNGGRDDAAVAAADSGFAASSHERRQIEHELGYEIVRAFQHIVQARRSVQAREAELEAIERSLGVAVARFEAGAMLKTDVLNFEVEQARASENLIIARHRQELAEKIFLNLLGLGDGSAAVEPDVEADQEVPDRPGYRRRPEIAALQARLEAARAELDRARGGLLPTVDGFASYQVDHGWINDGSGDSWIAGVRLDYNLWDGRLDRAEIAGKLAAYRRLEAQLAKLELAVNLDLEEAELNYDQAVKRRSVTDKLVEVATESARLSREQFKEGVILSSELVDAEVRLTDALVRQAAARAGYRIAVADLRRAAGYQQFEPAPAEQTESQP